MGTVGGTIAPFLAVGATIVGAKYARRTGEEANSTANWDSFMRQQREWTKEVLTERDRKIAALEEHGKEVEQHLTILDRKHEEAIKHIALLPERLSRHEQPEEPPEVIRRDVKT